MSDPIAGWYPDAAVPGQQRYWDGTQWTEHVAPLAPGAFPSAFPTAVRYAHWGQRVGAYLIDGLVTAIPAIAAAILIEANTTTVEVGGITYTTETPGSGVWTIAIVLFLSTLGLVIWNLFIRQGTTGYSVGKQVVGIKLVREATGQPIGGGLAFGRYILHILDGIPLYLGYLWPIWDAKKQTFADKLANTVVIVEPRRQPSS